MSPVPCQAADLLEAVQLWRCGAETHLGILQETRTQFRYPCEDRDMALDTFRRVW